MWLCNASRRRGYQLARGACRPQGEGAAGRARESWRIKEIRQKIRQEGFNTPCFSWWLILAAVGSGDAPLRGRAGQRPARTFCRKRKVKTNEYVTDFLNFFAASSLQSLCWLLLVLPPVQSIFAVCFPQQAAPPTMAASWTKPQFLVSMTCCAATAPRCCQLPPAFQHTRPGF